MKKSNRYLYKAKKSFAPLVSMVLLAVFLYYIYFVVQLPFLKDYYDVAIKWFILCFIGIVLMFSIYFSEFFLSSLVLTKEGIVIKKVFKKSIILYSELISIEKVFVYRLGERLRFNLKNNNYYLYPNIRDFYTFVKTIESICPEFNNNKALIKSYENSIRENSKVLIALIFIILLLLCESITKGSNSINEGALYIIISIMFFCLISVIKLFFLIKERYYNKELKAIADVLEQEEIFEAQKKEKDENIITNFCPICGEKLNNFECQRCEIDIDNIYSVKKLSCINCGKKRIDLEEYCGNCGLKFNLYD